MTALTASTKTSIICMVKVGSSSSSSSNDCFLGVWIRLPYSIKREHCSRFNGNEAVLAGGGEDVSKSSTPLWMMGQEHGRLVPVGGRDWWHQGNGEAIIWWGSVFRVWNPSRYLATMHSFSMILHSQSWHVIFMNWYLYSVCHPLLQLSPAAALSQFYSNPLITDFGERVTTFRAKEICSL